MRLKNNKNIKRVYVSCEDPSRDRGRPMYGKRTVSSCTGYTIGIYWVEKKEQATKFREDTQFIRNLKEMKADFIFIPV